MKKLLLTLPLFLLPMFASAQVPIVASFGIQAESATTTDVQIFTACSQAAIEVRDSTIGSARTAYNNAMNIALDGRKEAEKTAVAILDSGAKKDAIKIAVDEYKKAVTQAQDALTKARKEAWEAFEANTIGCRDMGKNSPSDSRVMKKESSTLLKAENKATVRTMQAEISADLSTETKVETKSFGELIRSQIDSIKNFFKR
jgi:ABC-type Na+ efflux pump permease subunit